MTIIFSGIFLALVGGWAYSRVSVSLKDLRASGLKALLEAEARVMLLWIDEKKRDVERLAARPEFRRHAGALMRLADRGANPGEICAAEPQRALRAEMASLVTMEQAANFSLVARNGMMLSSSQGEASCGLRLANEVLMTRLASVFAGSTAFVPDRPLSWIVAPVRAGEGAVAALAIGRDAGQRFVRLLEITGMESSREAFAFDTHGAMLSASRFQADSAVAGRSGMSRLVRTAVEGIRAGDPEALQGVLLEPYRNHRDVDVIGAWRWLPERDMAVAVEIEAAEAYAPLQYLQIAFAVLFGFALLSALSAAGLSLWAARLHLRQARRIGQYEIEREIGEGGMSHVYLARHSRLTRPTALKVLKAHLVSDESVARFEREVQLCSQLTHPNTIEVYDYGRTVDGLFYYAMEYLRGISLEELVRREGPMPVSRTVHAIRQACGSLREAHRRGLVHRDVKPHNLMLCMRGGQYDVVKVLDFGLVKKVNAQDTRDITQFAKVLGTPLYMAPERLRNPADSDARADIYALGAVAMFLLTGRRLFEAETDHDLVNQVLNAAPPTAAARGATDVPPILEALLARCLAKDRESRPASMDEMDAVLAEVALQRPWRDADARAWWEERAGALGIGDFEEVAAGSARAPGVAG